jgi:hypothetical protein
VEAKAVVEDGDPAHAIEWTAKQEQSELVMMSMEGKGTLRRVLKGSLPAKVLHTLQCPVYISPHKRGELPSSPDGFQTILCAVPPEPESEAALGIAVRECVCCRQGQQKRLRKRSKPFLGSEVRCKKLAERL